MFKKILSILLVFVLITSIIGESYSDESPPSLESSGGCKNTFPNLISDICWKAVFPMRIGGQKIMDWGGIPDNISAITGNPDDYNPSEFICTCRGDGALPRVGIYVSFWEPDKIIEVIQRAWCFSFLWGWDWKGLGFPASYGTKGYKTGGHKNSTKKSFYQVHMVKVPLLALMDIFINADYCQEWFEDLDLFDLTEFDPLWHFEPYAAYIHPEALIFANPLAQAICAVDCLATTVWYPINALFWCAGCWGSMYPFSGHIEAVGSPVRQTSLLAARRLARLARLPIPPAMEFDTSSPLAKCGAVPSPILKKSQYRFSTVFPIPETVGWCAHGLGVTPYTWGEFRNIPGVGEYQIYMVFRKRNCCLILL